MTRSREITGGRIVSLEWYSPYTEPPDGMPRVLRWGTIPPGMDNQTAMQRLVDVGLIPKGYKRVLLLDSGCSFRSPEVMQKARLRNLRRRMINKVPLFADHEIADAVSRKPDYFSVDGCARDLEDKKAYVRRHEASFKKTYSPDRQIDLGRDAAQ